MEEDAGLEEATQEDIKDEEDIRVRLDQVHINQPGTESAQQQETIPQQQQQQQQQQHDKQTQKMDECDGEGQSIKQFHLRLARIVIIMVAMVHKHAQS